MQPSSLSSDTFISRSSAVGSASANRLRNLLGRRTDSWCGPMTASCGGVSGSRCYDEPPASTKPGVLHSLSCERVISPSRAAPGQAPNRTRAAPVPHDMLCEQGFEQPAARLAATGQERAPWASRRSPLRGWPGVPCSSHLTGPRADIPLSLPSAREPAEGTGKRPPRRWVLAQRPRRS